MYLRALALLQSAPGVVPEFQVRMSGALASLYIVSGRHSKAESLLLRYLPESLAEGDTDSAALLGAMGVVLTHKLLFSEAEIDLLETTRLLERSEDAPALEIRAIALSNLEELEVARKGSMTRATDYYKQAIEIMIRLPGASPGPFTRALAG